MIPLLNWLLHHWYVFFWLSIFGFFEGVRDFFVGIAESVAALGDRRHERRLELARAAARELPEPAARPKPGRCVHRNVKQVRAADDELVGWLCASCDTQLPADWAVVQEDL
jgi:hypothetical protein